MNIKETIMRRDGISAESADELISEARDALNEYLECGDTCSAHDICEEWFGLEPDYLFDLIN
jgi:hypothetical protein